MQGVGILGSLLGTLASHRVRPESQLFIFCAALCPSPAPLTEEDSEAQHGVGGVV